MNKITRLLLTFTSTLSISLSGLKAQNVAINTTGASASPNAILDLNTGNANNVGLIIPNVTLGASLNTFSPPMANAATAGDAGMMVYNAGGVQATGYYYWDGTVWIDVSSGPVGNANSGASMNGTFVTLGNAFGGISAQLLQNTEIPLNGYNIDFSGTGNVGIGLGANTAANQALEIGQTTNTIRINGLKAGGAFQTTPNNPSTYLMFSDVNGDVNSIPTGTSGNVMMQTASGPAWLPAGAINVFADNGLSMGAYTTGYVEIGGTPSAPSHLLGNSVIAESGYSLDFDLGTYTAGGTGSFLVTNGGPANAILSATSNGVGVNTGSAASSLDDSGSFGVGIINLAPIASSTTALTGDYSTIMATPPALGSTYTLTLPCACHARRIYTIVYYGSGAGIIDITSPINGSIMLNGAAMNPLQLSSNSVTIQSDGTNWNVINLSGVSTTPAPYFQNGSIAWGINGSYSWTVPGGITQVNIFMVGAGGGCASANAPGGGGGMVSGVLAVTPGEVLYITVGQGGIAGVPSTTGIGGGGGGSYVQLTNASGALLCGAGGGGGGAGTSYGELIGGNIYFASGFAGGGYIDNTIASLNGSCSLATAGTASGKGGASYPGYLTNTQSWRGLGLTNNPTSGKTYNGISITGTYGTYQTAIYGYTSNGSPLMSSPGVPVNANPNAGNGANQSITAAVDGEVAILW